MYATCIKIVLKLLWTETVTIRCTSIVVDIYMSIGKHNITSSVKSYDSVLVFTWQTDIDLAVAFLAHMSRDCDFLLVF